MIAETWSPQELQNAESLASLEGWGQDKRRTAMIAAELHNAVRLLAYWRSGNDKAKPPQMLTESNFLPRRVRQKLFASDPAVKHLTAAKKVTSVMNAICGF